MSDRPGKDGNTVGGKLTTVNRWSVIIFSAAFIALMGVGTPHFIRVSYTTLSVILSIYFVLRWMPKNTNRGMWMKAYTCALLLAIAGPVIDLSMTYYWGYAIAPVCWFQQEANVGLVRAVSAMGYAWAAATSVVTELGVQFFPSVVALCAFGAWGRRSRTMFTTPLFFIIPLTIGFYLFFGHILVGGLSWLLSPCPP